jgi:membrane protein
LIAQLGGLIGSEGSVALEGLLKSASHPAKSLIASAGSILMLIVGATSIFAELQSDLDRIWHVPAAAKPSGIWGMLRTRLLSFGLIVSIGFLLLISLVVSAGLAAFGKWYGAWFPGWVITMQVINQVVSLAFVSALFAMMYRILPSIRVAWRDVWRGAVVTAVLFTVGKFLIGMYLGKVGVSSGFGAAGSVVVLLVWVFYSAQIFLLGAEFTWLYAHSCGSRSGAREDAPHTPSSVSGEPESAFDGSLPGPANGNPPAVAPVASTRGARPGTLATAGLVWVGFGVVRSLMRGRGKTA